jgi:hypothetical protein
MMLFGLPVVFETNQNGSVKFLANIARRKIHTGKKIADFAAICKRDFAELPIFAEAECPVKRY